MSHPADYYTGVVTNPHAPARAPDQSWWPGWQEKSLWDYGTDWIPAAPSIDWPSKEEAKRWLLPVLPGAVIADTAIEEPGKIVDALKVGAGLAGGIGIIFLMSMLDD